LLGQLSIAQIIHCAPLPDRRFKHCTSYMKSGKVIAGFAVGILLRKAIDQFSEN
jgi:hypothetical protein